MIVFLEQSRVSLALLTTFFILTSGLFLPLTANTEEVQTMPEHSISITFNVAEAVVTGTSRITLPPGTPLRLDCGPLKVTGAVLEIEDKSQHTLVPGTDNTINLPASAKNQTVYLSWNLVATNPYASSNLISEDGITLAGFWHPIPDRDMHYRLEAELPGNFTGIAEGETVTYCKDKFNTRYLNTSFDHPIRSIHFAAGPYTVKYRKLENNIELAAFFFQEDLELAEEYLEKAAAYIQRYEKLIGPFPYTRYSIVENRLPTGYGMPTFTLLGQAVVRLPFIKDTSLGHEILHSWFGNSVFLKESSGNWIEGLTTYLADQLYAENDGKGAEYRKNQLLRYISYVTLKNTMPLQDFTNASDSQPMARTVRAIGYDKSSMLFHMLRIRLGDEAFFQGIADLYKKMKFKRAGWDDIEDIFSQASDAELTDFFAQWISRSDLPQFAIKNIGVDQVDGRSKVSFQVEQKNKEPYTFLLPVITKTRTGESRELLTINELKADVELTVDDLPVELLIDPGYDMMRDLSAQEVPPIWSFFLGATNKIAVLATPEDEQKYAPLIRYLESIDCDIILAEELDNADLQDGSFLFLGSSDHSQGLFAAPDHPDTGFTLDIRKNPLNTHEVMVLVASSGEQETASVIRKLRHYGKYSYLFFREGILQASRINPTQNGLHLELFAEPKGVQVPDIKSFDDIIESIGASKVVYVGEMHTDMGNHILQLQVIQALHQKNPNLAIGMEMFPRSSQQVLDEYIDGTITTEREFLKKSNYFSVWGYDYRYYREIINFARLHSIPIVALNIDKAIVSKVFQEGNLDGLADDQSQMIPPDRDLDVPGYSERLSRAFAAHDARSFKPEKMSGFLQAQSIWDEAMADSIVDYLLRSPDKQMVVIAGNGHVYKDSAIPLRVKRRMDAPQSVVASINHETNGLEPGYKVDYLVYANSYEIQPSPKVGIVLQEEKADDTDVIKRVRIVKLSPHGKAGEAGIKIDDIILAVEDEKIEDITDLKISLLDKKPGDKVTMKVLRKSILFGEKELELEVELSSPMNLQGKMPPAHPR